MEDPKGCDLCGEGGVDAEATERGTGFLGSFGSSYKGCDSIFGQ